MKPDSDEEELSTGDVEISENYEERLDVNEKNEGETEDDDWHVYETEHVRVDIIAQREEKLAEIRELRSFFLANA